jgi:YVTN family beta-propeller protein
MQRLSLCGAAALGALLSFACDTLDDKPPGTRTFRIVPTDERPAVQQEQLPPAISGGTLLAFQANRSGAGQEDLLAASDPARDRVSIAQDVLLQHVQLPSGSQPGRLATDGQGLLYVVLRGAGSVGVIDTVSGALIAQTPVCASPRGIAYDTPNEELVIACAEGKLVRYSPGQQTLREQQLDSDLRDVVVQGDVTFVSRFRTAEVLLVRQGQGLERVTLPHALIRRDSQDVESEFQELSPAVAWRMTSNPAGGVVVVHQRASVDAVATAADEEQVEVSETAYGGSAASLSSGPNCAGIVQTAVSTVSADGEVGTSGSISGAVLPVDVAVSQSGMIAVASAGVFDPETPATRFKVISDESGGIFDDLTAPPLFRTGVVLLPAQLIEPVARDEAVVERGCFEGSFAGEFGPATAVAEFRGYFVAQRREPALLSAVDSNRPGTIDLGGRSIADTGHDVFHRDTGAGIACASCHPEGEDDGHVWNFAGEGDRKTQHLALPLVNTAPFHWDGKLPTLNTLMDEVFVGRMGGVIQSPERMETLQDWVFQRPIFRPNQDQLMAESDLEAVARGKALFESTKVGCATCHSGDTLTDNKNYNVGTSDRGLQVPSLVGISTHPPFMHDGCAQTLEQRFTNEQCGGGDQHGSTSGLSAAELGDLVAYMKTL